MDVHVPQEQQKTIANQHAKAKDPKKQEAGRKGAAVRRQNLEALKAKLAAAKKVFSSGSEGTTGTGKAVDHCQTNNEEPGPLAVDTKTSGPMSHQVCTEGSCGGGRPRCGVGIAAVADAVAAGVVLFEVRPSAKRFAQRIAFSQNLPTCRREKRLCCDGTSATSESAQQRRKDYQTTCSRSVFDMD